MICVLASTCIKKSQEDCQQASVLIYKMQCYTSLFADSSDAADVHHAHDAHGYDDDQRYENKDLPQIVDELSAAHSAERLCSKHVAKTHTHTCQICT